MDTEHDADINGLFPTDGVDADGGKEDRDGAEEDRDGAEEDRNGKAERPAAATGRPRSRPDFGCLAVVAVLLAIVLCFCWLIVGAIVDVVKEDREAKLRRWQAFDTYRQSVERRSSGGSSYSGSKSGSGSSGGSSSYGSSGSTYQPKSKSGGREDEYNAADFRNPEDFYDEHYDDFLDYYDAENYWNEHN